jgi:ankyrin repeat protein
MEPAQRGKSTRTRRRPTPTRLLRAASDGSLSAVRRELSAGVDPNAQNADGETALSLAVCSANNAAVVRALLDAGADPNLPDNAGDTPLIAAVRDENLPVVRELVERGADVNAQNKQGDTPLTNAASWGSAKVVKYLLTKGADPRIADGENIGAAQLARVQNHPDIARMIEHAMR